MKALLTARHLILVLALGVLVLAGCGNDDTNTNTGAADETAEVEADEGSAQEEVTPPSTEATETTIDEVDDAPPPPEPEIIDLPVAVQVNEDIAYTSERSLDVYAPTEGSGWPVVVYFHGGNPLPGWRKTGEATLRAIAEMGVVVYAPDWNSFGPSGGSQDSICAVAYAEATAGDHGGDPEDLTLSGYSTGAFTAAIHGLVGDDPPLAVTDCAVDSGMSAPDAVAVGGTPFFVTDWARAGRLPMAEWSDLTPEQLDGFDPYLALGRNAGLVLALAVGEDDTGGPAAPPAGFPITEANVEYHEALLEAGYEVTLTMLPGGHELDPGTEKHDTFVAMIVETATATSSPG